MTKKLDLAYLAGIVDGEGCIRINKSKAYRCQDRRTPAYHAVILVRMTSKKIIRLIAETFGGWYYKEKRPQFPTRRLLFCYHISDAAAEKALQRLLPYLRLKKRQAGLLLKLRRHQRHWKRHKTKVIGYRNFPNKYGTVRMVPIKVLSDSYIQQCESLYLRAKELNRVGVRPEEVGTASA